MAATLPVNVTEVVPLPATVAPEIPGPALICPAPTAMVTAIVFVPESMSPTTKPRPAKDKAVCSVTLGRLPPSLLMVGASLTPTTATVRVIAPETFVLASFELSVTVTAIWRATVLGLSDELLNVTVRSTLW